MGWALAVATVLSLGALLVGLWYAINGIRSKGGTSTAPIIQYRGILRDERGDHEMIKKTQIDFEEYEIECSGNYRKTVYTWELWPLHNVDTAFSENTIGGRAVWVYRKSEADPNGRHNPFPSGFKEYMEQARQGQEELTKENVPVVPPTPEPKK